MPSDRWKSFTEEEVCTILGALADSGGMRSDHDWYLRCSKLRSEIVNAVLTEIALRGALGEQPDAK